MYGLVLATALTASVSAPDFGFHHHGCSGGWGCCGYSSCYGCSGCYGGSGCYGCYGCSGCSGCCGYSSSFGCCGYSGCCGYMPAMGAYSCGGCCGYSACYGCSGYSSCYGCCGYVSAAPVYGTPAPVAPGMKPAEGSTGSVMQPATVVVKAPTDVKITVNGQATTRRTAEESFSTPLLNPGRTYSYAFVAERTVDGKKETAKKDVTVVAGKETVVDFSNFRAAVASTDEAPAKVTVVLSGEGKVFVNDVEMKVSGKRTFVTPALTKGQRYFYTVKAEVVKAGKTSTETRRVNVEAGKTVTVDFTAEESLTASR